MTYYETIEVAPLPPDQVAVNRARWVEALESGDYPQTTGELRNSTGFCCLGVVEDLRGADWDHHNDPEADGDSYWIAGRRLTLVDAETREPLPRPDCEWPTRLVIGTNDSRNHAVLTGDGAHWLGLIETDPTVVVWDEDEGWKTESLTHLNDEREYDFRRIAAIVRDQDPTWNGTATWATRNAHDRADRGVPAPAYSRWSA